MKSAVICALLAAMFITGSAWADESSVEAAITAYGLTRQGGESGSTITVTGSVSKLANDVLDLGDITGLTIDWKADLTVTGGSRPEGMGIINFANGSFNLADGTIQFPTGADGIMADGAANMTVNGGTMKSQGVGVCGIAVVDGTLTIDSGEINIPKGKMLFAHTLTVNAPSVLTGLAFTGELANYFTATVYGHAVTVTGSTVLNDDDDELPIPQSYVVPNGATWDIQGLTSDLTNMPTVATAKITVKGGGKLNLKNNTDLKFKGSFHVEQNGELNIEDTSRLTIVGGTATDDGTINIYGTLTNKDKLVNSPTGIINVFSGNTLDNQGTLTNNGIINNKSTGKITNTGNISNANGTINNTEGGTFQSVQTASAMGGTVNGDVQPISSGGGSGCDAGLGIAGLLLAGLVALKRRKA
jgi:hypothetical protein